MILVDANLLLYASVTSFPEYPRASKWLDSQLNGRARVGLPWPSLLAFLRLVTNARVFPRPLVMQSAWRQVETWLSCDSVWVPAPTDRHSVIMAELLSGAQVSGNLVHDAHLAALAIEHGLELASNDSDFARFTGLRWTNPLAA